MSAEKLTDIELKILSNVNLGRNRTDYLVEDLGMDLSDIYYIVESLIHRGYLTRGKFLTGLVKLQITEKGKSVLPPPRTPLEKELQDAKLSVISLKILKAVKDGIVRADMIEEKLGIPSNFAVVELAYLEELGYVKMRGLTRCKYQITDKGIQALSKFAALMEVRVEEVKK
jgi:predicted transcriptional regulator